MTHAAHAITYSSVVTKEAACIILTMAALHEPEVNAVKILNTYVMAPKRDKTWTVLGQCLGTMLVRLP